MTFGVVGYGRFGKLWAKELAKFGSVRIFDRSKHSDALPKGVVSSSIEEVAKCDMVFVASPISSFESVLKTLKPFVREDGIILDVCSVKMRPTEAMKRAWAKGPSLIGTHPLFGPESAHLNGDSIAGLRIAVTPVRTKKSDLDRVITLFRKLKLSVIVTTPAEHDRSMAPSQALVHLIGRALQAFHLKEREIATPDYSSLVRISDLVGKNSWVLFRDMQSENPFADKMRETFSENLELVETELMKERGDIPALRDAVEATDRKIVLLLARRALLTKKLGLLKRAKGLAITDKNREKALSAAHQRSAKKFGADKTLVDVLFKEIITHSKKNQARLANRG